MARSPKKNSDLVKDIIIGVSDGLTVPFALTAGMSGVLSTNHLVIVSGIAEIAAGCISMGLGGFLSGESESDHYDSLANNEYHEIETIPESELKEVENVFLDLGVDKSLSKKVAKQISHNKDSWVDFMMKFEIGLEKPMKNRAMRSGFNIAVSYLAGGLVPLFPYLLTKDNNQGLLWSCILTIIALVIFGYFKSRMSGQNLLKGTLKVTLIGVVAAAAAYFLAKAVS